MILCEPESIIFTFFWDIDCVFHFFTNIFFELVVRPFMVSNSILRLYDLHSDVAIFDIWVRNDLHVVVLNLLKRHYLVVIRHMIIQKLFDEICA